MIENLETLLTLARTGTMLEASTELRITQSAVSKRISSLERYYDRKLIQKKGRRVELTQHGQRLVDKLSPLLSELRDLFIDEVADARGSLVIGVSDAILSSWGPSVFHKVQATLPEVSFEFHTHRTPVVLDRIRSGCPVHLRRRSVLFAVGCLGKRAQEVWGRQPLQRVCAGPVGPLVLARGGRQGR